MPENYILLERIELNASASSVTFSNIPQTGYTDLKIVMSVRDTYAAVSAALFVGFNGGTTSLSSKYIQGSGSSAVSGNLSSLAIAGLNTGANATANTFSNIELYIPNYTSSNYKSYSADSVTENNATEAYTNLIAGLWSNTAAITSMTFTCGTAFTAGSTFSLYGIAALGTTPAIAPKATGGNVIATDGTYWYHAFLASGAFTPLQGITCDVLQIAGGGGGVPSSASSGGSGAGGVSYLATQSLLTQNYAVTVGAGGSGGTMNSSYIITTSPTQGNNSQFASLTAAVGGGYGGSGNGGSGGGGTTNSGTGGTGTPGQGNNGGNAGTGGNFYSGGGGGAGAAGGAGTSGLAVGGVGTSAYSSWGLATGTGQNVSGTVYYAGGGGGSSNGVGGGAGGYGGGGQGATANKTLATAGTANTGGGTGGGSNIEGIAQTAPNGGSGIVIIRYPVAS